MNKRNIFMPFQLFKFAYKRFANLPYRAKIYLGLLTTGAIVWPKYNKAPSIKSENIHKRAITDYVYMDIAMDNVYLGRILIGLYGRLLPLTVENFISMCEGFVVKDKKIGYLNTRFDKIMPNTAIVGGKLFNNKGKLDSCTIYGRRMPEESFDTSFIQEGDVAMLSDGPLGVSSRFFITLTRNPGFQQKSVVVGTVVKGMKLIRMIGEGARKDGMPNRDIRYPGKS
nr:peptidyl-prolyl cis-trans isomerase [Theileria orientalis]